MASVRRLGSHSDETMCRSNADLNLGCPQEIAREEHFGAYLLAKKDWPLVQGIGKPAKRVFCSVSALNTSQVSSLSRSLSVPVSAKLRLCSPASSTLTLASN